MNISTSSKPERLKRIFTHNFREKFLAALCAAVVLLLAFCFKQVQRTYTFAINTKIAEDQVLVSQNVYFAEVKVSGNFFDLRRIDIENLAINFDFSAEKAGEISKKADENLLPAPFKNLVIKNIFPETLMWRTETKIEKTVPVNILFEEGNDNGNYIVEPSEIKITGAESVVNGLDKINSEKIPMNAFADKAEVEISLSFPKLTVSTENITNVKVTRKAAGEETAETQKTEENTEKTENEEQ